MSSSILVVDDEPNIRDLLSQTLRLVGFRVQAVGDGRAALAAVASGAPDLVVLDIALGTTAPSDPDAPAGPDAPADRNGPDDLHNLDDLDGIAVAKHLRARGHDVPVLFLTARDAVEDRIAGLAAGADDYVTKPFSLEEIVLRIRAILRRSRAAAEAAAPEDPADRVLRYADLELRDSTHEVRRAGRPVALSPTEFRLLRYLMENAGRVVSKSQILDRVWHYDFGGDGRIVESCVYYLRKKIDGAGPPLIHTLRGVGYSLRLPPEQG